MANRLPRLGTLALLICITTVYHIIVTSITSLNTDLGWHHGAAIKDHVILGSKLESVPWSELIELLTRMKRLHRGRLSADDVNVINVTISVVQTAFPDMKTYNMSEVVGSKQDSPSILKNNQFDQRPSEKIIPAKVVCPEVYKGSTYGLPFLDTGWVMQNCSVVPPFQKVLTLLFNFINKAEKLQDVLALVVDPAMTLYQGVPIKAAISEEQYATFKDKLPSNVSTQVEFVVFAHNSSHPGNVWNCLVRKVQTPYVFIGRDVIYFDNDTRLERLVREVSETEADVAGGAVRSRQGHWSISCLQSVLRNYTLVYVTGYYKSLHSCVFCSHTHAPFVMSRNFAQHVPFSSELDEEVTFSNFFLRLTSSGRRIVVCPDVMFHSGSVTHDSPKRKWRHLAKNFGVTNIVFETSRRIVFNCDELNIKCGLSHFPRGLAVPPCCLRQLASMVKFFHKTCDDYGLLCEAKEGTLLGAVKFNGVLPWERDADLGFLTANFSVLLGLKKFFIARGYDLAKTADPWCCADGREAGGIFYLTKKDSRWRVEIYGDHRLNSETLMDKGWPRTRLLFDGQWVGVPRNPGLYSRNHYGTEIYQHAQHWLVMGKKSGWADYLVKRFTKCPVPGHHYCLDQYEADGNMQFREPSP